MKTSNVLIGFLISISSLSVNAENTDSIRINNLEKALRTEVKVRENLKAEIISQKTIIEKQSAEIDSLRNNICVNSQNIQSTAKQLGVKIDETNLTLGSKANSEELQSKTIWGVAIIALLAVVFAVVAFLLGKRINKGHADVDELKRKAEKLNEDIVGNFSQEMEEMQKISSSMDVLAKTSGNPVCSTEQDHSLIKTLADRITFMEMTLYKMDSKVKGHKQLSKSISQMKDNLLANGYELVEMLGKPYNDGMKAVANFNDDEEIEVGQRIITAVIKPQINYNGEMIQAAQITVSQNL